MPGSTRERPEVRDFAELILDDGPRSPTPQFIPATEEQVSEARTALDS